MYVGIIALLRVIVNGRCRKNTARFGCFVKSQWNTQNRRIGVYTAPRLHLQIHLCFTAREISKMMLRCKIRHALRLCGFAWTCPHVRTRSTSRAKKQIRTPRFIITCVFLTQTSPRNRGLFYCPQ